MKLLRKLALLVGLVVLFGFVTFPPPVRAACSWDAYGACLGTCTGGTCQDNGNSCVCTPNATSVPPYCSKAMNNDCICGCTETSDGGTCKACPTATPVPNCPYSCTFASSSLDCTNKGGSPYGGYTCSSGYCCQPPSNGTACGATKGSCPVGDTCNLHGSVWQCDPSSCNGSCNYVCDGSSPNGGSCSVGQTPVCNLSTCNCGCTTVTSACCTTWSNWGTCSGGYQTRNCQSPGTCNDSQTQACGAPAPTDTPVPTATRTPTPTPTRTPTPTPTPIPPGPWVKLRDASFSSHNDLVNLIPLAPVAYNADDADDTPANNYFIRNQSGVVSAPNIKINDLNPSAKVNSNNWRAEFTPAPFSMTPPLFYSYVKARKEYVKINALSEINANGIYYYQGASPLNISAPAIFNQFKVVVISPGVVNVTADLNDLNLKSVAIVADTINFSPTVAEANGIFIANNITTGASNTQGLKINGNLVAQETFDNSREWPDLNMPSVFVVFKPDIYLDLVPYLSTASYDWHQSQ